MLHGRSWGAVLAALAVLLGLLVARPAFPVAPGPVRIMPLGDSITGSPGCWRAVLWKRLRDSGHTGVDFVGTRGPQWCGQPYDGDNEGHGGLLATDLADRNLLPARLAATRPHVVLMHFGTNDVRRDVATAAVLAAFGKLVDQMRAGNPAVKVVVAQIVPMAPAGCGECGRRVVALNNAIPGWAAAKSTRRSPVTVVDQWSGFSTATHTYDGVHPNAAGERRISDRWYPAVVAALTAGSTTPATPAPPPATAPGATTTRAGGRRARWAGAVARGDYGRGTA